MNTKHLTLKFQEKFQDVLERVPPQAWALLIGFILTAALCVKLWMPNTGVRNEPIWFWRFIAIGCATLYLAAFRLATATPEIRDWFFTRLGFLTRLFFSWGTEINQAAWVKVFVALLVTIPVALYYLVPPGIPTSGSDLTELRYKAETSTIGQEVSAIGKFLWTGEKVPSVERELGRAGVVNTSMPQVPLPRYQRTWWILIVWMLLWFYALTDMVAVNRDDFSRWASATFAKLRGAPKEKSGDEKDEKSEDAKSSGKSSGYRGEQFIDLANMLLGLIAVFGPKGKTPPHH